MAKVTKCDQCNNEIHEYGQFYTLTPENTPTSFAKPYVEKQFCTMACLADYASRQAEEEV